MTPPPGSPEAIQEGCECPVIDNGHGRGYYQREGHEPLYVIAHCCPVHGPKDGAEYVTSRNGIRRAE